MGIAQSQEGFSHTLVIRAQDQEGLELIHGIQVVAVDVIGAAQPVKGAGTVTTAGVFAQEAGKRSGRCSELTFAEDRQTGVKVLFLRLLGFEFQAIDLNRDGFKFIETLVHVFQPGFNIGQDFFLTALKQRNFAQQFFALTSQARKFLLQAVNLAL